MSFWRLRTLVRSPSCDALKILCRSRRTVRSVLAQSMLCQYAASSNAWFPEGVAASCIMSMSVTASSFGI